MKYIELENDSYSLDEKIDLSFEMSTNHKEYQATFLQMPVIDQTDSMLIYRYAIEECKEEFSSDTVEKMLEENNLSDEVNEYLNRYLIAIKADMAENKRVWFNIIKNKFDTYQIYLYYDNERNLSNGSDL